MFERRVTKDEVRRVLETGEVIENYPDDTPYPSRLVLGKAGSRKLHVVAADNEVDKETIVITVYAPEPAYWDPTLRRRLKQ
ncbi:MAG: DUF4258 domain-containing protein [bacterium]